MLTKFPEFPKFPGAEVLLVPEPEPPAASDAPPPVAVIPLKTELFPGVAWFGPGLPTVPPAPVVTAYGPGLKCNCCPLVPLIVSKDDLNPPAPPPPSLAEDPPPPPATTI